MIRLITLLGTSILLLVACSRVTVKAERPGSRADYSIKYQAYWGDGTFYVSTSYMDGLLYNSQHAQEIWDVLVDSAQETDGVILAENMEGIFDRAEAIDLLTSRIFIMGRSNGLPADFVMGEFSSEFDEICLLIRPVSSLRSYENAKRVQYAHYLSGEQGIFVSHGPRCRQTEIREVYEAVAVQLEVKAAAR